MTLTILLPWLVLVQLLACGTPHFGVNVFGLAIVTGGYLFWRARANGGFSAVGAGAAPDPAG